MPGHLRSVPTPVTSCLDRSGRPRMQARAPAPRRSPPEPPRAGLRPAAPRRAGRGIPPARASLGGACWNLSNAVVAAQMLQQAASGILDEIEHLLEAVRAAVIRIRHGLGRCRTEFREEPHLRRVLL